MPTPKEWLDAATSEWNSEAAAGFSVNGATAEVLAHLIPGWSRCVEDGVSCKVLIHDLLEVASNLRQVHDSLKAKLPGVLDEIAAID